MIVQLVSELVKPGYLPKAGPASIAPYFPGMNLAIRRSSFDALGGFDEALRTGEDIDLCLRGLASEDRLFFAPEAVVRHHARPTMQALWRQWFDYGRYHARLYDKHVRGRIELMWLDRRRADGRYRVLLYRERAPVRAIVFVNPFFLAMLATVLAPLAWWLPIVAWLNYLRDDLGQPLIFAPIRAWINLALLTGGLRGSLSEGFLFIYGTVWTRSR